MSFIEFTGKKNKYLMDFESGWEVIDMGPDQAAHWVNHDQGRNMDCTEPYEQVKKKLLGSQRSEQLGNYTGLMMQGLILRHDLAGFEYSGMAISAVGAAKALIAELEKEHAQ